MVPLPAAADPRAHAPFLFLFKMTGHQKDRLQASVRMQEPTSPLCDLMRNSLYPRKHLGFLNRKAAAERLSSCLGCSAWGGRDGRRLFQPPLCPELTLSLQHIIQYTGPSQAVKAISSAQNPLPLPTVFAPSCMGGR